MAKFSASSTEKITETFEIILGKDVEIKEGGDITPNDCCSAAIYVDNDGKMQAACLFDLPLSAYTSAALSMINADVANDAVQEGALSNNLKENLYEIFNISVALFNERAQTGIRIKDVHISPEKIPAPLISMLEKSPAQSGYDMSIDSYGNGKLRLYFL